MTYDATIRLGDLIIVVVSAGLIPLVRLAARTLWELREAVQKLTHLVMGLDGTQIGGVMGDVAALKVETRKHRDRLIAVESELGMKIRDRT